MRSSNVVLKLDQNWVSIRKVCDWVPLLEGAKAQTATDRIDRSFRFRDDVIIVIVVLCIRRLFVDLIYYYDNEPW